MTYVITRSLVALAALFVSILAAGPVVDKIATMGRRAWYIFAAEAVVTVVLWLSLLLLLRVI